MFHPDQRYVDKNLKVIYLVKRHPLVYTSSSRKVRREMWEQIDKACGSDKMQARNRWRRLVHNFCTHIINVAKKTPRRDVNRVSKRCDKVLQLGDWCYFRYMRFMLPYIKGIVGETNLKAIQEELKKNYSEIDEQDIEGEDDLGSEEKLDLIELKTDIGNDNEKPATSDTHILLNSDTSRKHKDSIDMSPSNQSKNTEKVPMKARVDDKVYKIKLDNPVWLEAHSDDLEIKKKKPNSDDINSDEVCSTSAVAKPAKSTMTDNSPATPFEELSPEEQSLKAFFDSMLRTTQRLPEFHQRRIKGDLVKALRTQGVEGRN